MSAGDFFLKVRESERQEIRRARAVEEIIRAQTHLLLQQQTKEFVDIDKIWPLDRERKTKTEPHSYDLTKINALIKTVWG